MWELQKEENKECEAARLPQPNKESEFSFQSEKLGESDDMRERIKLETRERTLSAFGFFFAFAHFLLYAREKVSLDQRDGSHTTAFGFAIWVSLKPLLDFERKRWLEPFFVQKAEISSGFEWERSKTTHAHTLCSLILGRSFFSRSPWWGKCQVGWTAG